MKIALAHDFLIQNGGAEKVLKSFHNLYNEAPVYTLFSNIDNFVEFQNAEIRNSFLQKFPFIKKKYRWYLPFFATATESLNFSDYDVVLSSVSGFIKGIITKPYTVHIAYCHSPTRYLWSDTHSYVENINVNFLVKKMLPFTLKKNREWDRLAADRVDYFIANSELVRKRIKKYYKVDSKVIYPPVEVNRFFISNKVSDYFLAGGRLVAYKRIDLIVKAFNRLGLKLYIYGSGPEYKKLKQMAKSNIKFLGRVNEEDLQKLYSEALAYIQPQVEDFGITAVESMASGRPVIAYRAGGSLETVKENLSGIFFDDQDWASLIKAVLNFKAENFDPIKIREWSLNFSEERFQKEINDFIKEKYQEHKNNL